MSSKRLTPDWIDTYMEYVHNTEPPDNYKRWVAISVIAGALQRKCCLEWGPELTWYPNMYIVLVGPPGKARKGTAMAAGRRFLRDLNISMSAESTTREALVRALANANMPVINNETGLVKFHSSLTVFSPELTVFLGSQNHQLMYDITDWWDCADDWTYDTKASGTDDIKGVWVNLIGATTPELIRTALPMNAVGSGLASRIIFVFEQSGKRIPVPTQTDKEIELRLKLSNDLERIHNLQGTFKVTQNLVDAWTHFYTVEDLDPPFKDKNLEGYLSRRPTHAMKLSMICSASRSDELIIRAEDFNRALTFLKQVERKMPQVFTGIGKDRNADIMASLMNEIALRKTVPVRDLMGMYCHDVDSRTFDGMIQTLDMINYIDIIISGSVGENIIKYRGESTAAINDAIKASMEGQK